MKTPHTLPVPPDVLSRASDRLKVADRRMPFVQDGKTVGTDLLAAALEELNAEPNRTLAIRCRRGENGRVIADGLDRRLSQRGFPEEGTAETVAEVLISAVIAAKASITDRRSHRFIRAVRLLPGWTWTIATGGTGEYRSTGIPGSDGGHPAWTDLCPVCREGRLLPAEGQRLFGVHGTDFLVCTSCGARFVAEAGKFRLVSIAKKRDPAWASLLNRQLSGDEWRAVARGGSGLKITIAPGSAAEKTGRKARSKSPARPSAKRFALDVGERTLYFTPLRLQFGKGMARDLFAKRKEPLREILRLPAYHDCAVSVVDKYRTWLDAPVGFFLVSIRDRRDSNFRKFLNEYGNNTFCMFMAADADLAQKRGVWIVVHDGTVCAAGESLCSFAATVNEELGCLQPMSCYRDGSPERCRINSIVCGNRQAGGGLFVYPVEREDEIRKLAREIGSSASSQN